MATLLDTINERRIQQGLPPIQENGRSFSNGYTNENDLGTLAETFLLGNTKMANDMVLGGGGAALGGLGRLVEWLSPYSGEGISENNRRILNSLGYSNDYINQIAPYEDSWITSLAKGSLELQNQNNDRIDAWRQDLLGDNPTPVAKMTEGAGTSTAYMGLGALLSYLGGGLTPLKFALGMGGSEALAETGGFLGDAYREGQYDNGALPAAGKNFLTNMAINSTLDYFLSPLGTLQSKVANPVGRYLAGTGSSIVNEMLQEPSQQVIEQASMNSLNKGTGFLSELGESAKQWPEMFTQLAPEVAGSTLITQGLLAPFGLKGNIAYNRSLGDINQRLGNVREQINNMRNEQERAKLQKEYNELSSQVNNLGYYNTPKVLEQPLTELNNLENSVNDYFDNLLDKKLQLQRPTTERVNIQPPSVKIVKDLERPAIERPFGMDDPLLQPPVNENETGQPVAQPNPLPDEITQALEQEKDNLLEGEEMLNWQSQFGTPNAHEAQEGINNLLARVDDIDSVIKNSDIDGAKRILGDRFDGIMEAKLQALRPKTERINIQPPNVETIRDLERPSIERPFEMDDPLLQPPVDNQRAARSYRNAFEAKQAENRHLLNILGNAHLNDNGELASPPRTQSITDFTVEKPQVVKDLARPRAQNIPVGEINKPNVVKDEFSNIERTNAEKVEIPQIDTAKTERPFNSPLQKPLVDKGLKEDPLLQPPKREVIEAPAFNGNATQQSETQPAKNTASVRTQAGTRIDTRYRIIEADNLITSHNENGGLNPEYPQELQNRQRNREQSIRDINAIASNLTPELLGESQLASDGAPIIASDLTVESGNGRTMAIRQAYKNGWAGKYKEWLVDNAAKFGLDPYSVSKMKNPILVRERVTDVDRVKFASEANVSNVARMSATETAKSDAGKINDSMLMTFDTERSLAANRSFINEFSKIVPQSEQGDFRQESGEISKSGLERIQNAMLAKAYGDTDIINHIAEVTDDDKKNVSNSLINAAPKIAMFENGGYADNLSIKKDITEAVKIYKNAKKEGLSVEAYLGQGQLFENNTSSEAQTLARFFDKNKRSAKKITQALIRYADSATKLKNALKEMSKKRERGLLGNTAKKITTAWKVWTIGNPARNFLYNVRNFSGDLDAVIAGNWDVLKKENAGRAFKELVAHLKGKETSQDLKDFLERSGGKLNIESMNFSDKEIHELENFTAENKKNPSIIGKGWGLLKKVFSKELELTQLRENWLRYAAYLAYKKDMDANNGRPSAWGASNKEDIMALSDVRDRA